MMLCMSTSRVNINSPSQRPAVLSTCFQNAEYTAQTAHQTHTLSNSILVIRVPPHSQDKRTQTLTDWSAFSATISSRGITPTLPARRAPAFPVPPDTEADRGTKTYCSDTICKEESNLLEWTCERGLVNIFSFFDATKNTCLN